MEPSPSDSAQAELKRTPFHDFHLSAGGRMVPFAGWLMPIVYRSILDEHAQTRVSGSLFDVSHMGRVRFAGPDATRFLDRVVTRNLSQQKVGQCRYGLICNAAGGIRDDVIVYRDERDWLMVVNASNRTKLLEHFEAVRANEAFDVTIKDQTEATAMLALQGPAVIEKLADVLPDEIDLRAMRRYTFATAEVMLTRLIVSRTGYTGEDGVEVILPAKAAPMAMRYLAGRTDAADATVKPAGLGARDTLRLEAGMPLYGHELGEAIEPLSAGLGWAVDLSKGFIGAEALRKVAADGPRRKLVGLELDGRRIARQGSVVTADGGGAAIGEVTSGTFSPTLQKSIAMAYVDAALAAPGTALSVDLKGTANAARVVPLPFYKRATLRTMPTVRRQRD